MVCVYSKDNAYIRSEMKKTVEIFACFGYEIVRRADADISADRFKYSADGYSGVKFCGHYYFGNHGSCSCFSVSTGNGNTFFVPVHYRSQKSCSFYNRYIFFMRRQYFRIIRLYCRSIYDYIRIVGYIIRFLTDSNGYSLFFKAVGYLGILYIGT